MWWNVQAIGWPIETIFRSDDRFKADKGVVGCRDLLRPDLYSGEDIVIVARKFSDSQCAVPGDLKRDGMRKWVGIIRRLSIPLEGRNIETRGTICFNMCFGR